MPLLRPRCIIRGIVDDDKAILSRLGQAAARRLDKLGDFVLGLATSSNRSYWPEGSFDFAKYFGWFFSSSAKCITATTGTSSLIGVLLPIFSTAVAKKTTGAKDLLSATPKDNERRAFVTPLVLAKEWGAAPTGYPRPTRLWTTP